MAFPTGYTGYDTVTLPNPSATLTDFFYYLNGNLLSDEWWAAVKSDGGDVQAYKTDGTRLPVYLHNWQHGTQNSGIFFGYSGSKLTSDESVRLYAGNAANSQPAVGAAFGRNAVWPAAL